MFPLDSPGLVPTAAPPSLLSEVHLLESQCSTDLALLHSQPSSAPPAQLWGVSCSDNFSIRVIVTHQSTLCPTLWTYLYFNKTKYLRLWLVRLRESWSDRERALKLWVETLRLRALDNLELGGQTDERTNIVTPWAPVGVKNKDWQFSLPDACVTLFVLPGDGSKLGSPLSSHNLQLIIQDVNSHLVQS